MSDPARGVLRGDHLDTTFCDDLYAVTESAFSGQRLSEQSFAFVIPVNIRVIKSGDPYVQTVVDEPQTLGDGVPPIGESPLTGDQTR